MSRADQAELTAEAIEWVTGDATQEERAGQGVIARRAGGDGLARPDGPGGWRWLE